MMTDDVDGYKVMAIAHMAYWLFCIVLMMGFFYLSRNMTAVTKIEHRGPTVRLSQILTSERVQYELDFFHPFLCYFFQKSSPQNIRPKRIILGMNVS